MQAHDDLVNSDFLHQPAKHFLNAITILLSKITYCEYKCLFIMIDCEFDIKKWILECGLLVFKQKCHLFAHNLNTQKEIIGDLVYIS